MISPVIWFPYKIDHEIYIGKIRCFFISVLQFNVDFLEQQVFTNSPCLYVLFNRIIARSRLYPGEIKYFMYITLYVFFRLISF
jgi:hypothetical protein